MAVDIRRPFAKKTRQPAVEDGHIIEIQKICLMDWSRYRASQTGLKRDHASTNAIYLRVAERKGRGLAESDIMEVTEATFISSRLSEHCFAKERVSSEAVLDKVRGS